MTQTLPLARPLPSKEGLSIPLFATFFVFAAAAGFAVIQVAGRLAGPTPNSCGSYPLSWPLWVALVPGSLERAVLLSFSLIGLVSGLVHPRRAWLLGFATVAFFPLAIVIELVRDGSTHNLWPMEVGAHLFLAMPAVAGALVGALIRWKCRAKPEAAGPSPSVTVAGGGLQRLRRK